MQLKKCIQRLRLGYDARFCTPPVKIVWINQTNQLSLFTSVADELTMRKYVETVVRRTFGTKDAMKIGIPVPICWSTESKQ